MTSPRDGTRITGVRQIAITVSNVAAATTFYRDVLGLSFLFAAGPDLAFLDIGGVRLMLAAPEGHFVPGGRSSVVYLTVADINATHSLLAERGVVFPSAPTCIAAMPDHDLWLCAFADPDGNPLALMSEVPRSSDASP